MPLFYLILATWPISWTIINIREIRAYPVKYKLFLHILSPAFLYVKFSLVDTIFIEHSRNFLTKVLFFWLCHILFSHIRLLDIDQLADPSTVQYNFYDLMVSCYWSNCRFFHQSEFRNKIIRPSPTLCLCIYNPFYLCTFIPFFIFFYF